MSPGSARPTSRATGVSGWLGSLVRPGRSGAVVLLGLLLAGLAIGFVGEAERTPSSTDSAPVDAESTEVTELLETFPTSGEQTAVAVFASEERISTADLAQLQQLFESVAGPASESGPPARLIPSEDGTVAIGVLDVPGAGATEVSAEVEQIRADLDDRLPAGVTAGLTGPAAVQADLAAVFDGANTRLLLATASVVAVVLIITYRSPVLWLVPLTVVALADRAAVAAATHTLAALDLAWDESTVGILSVLVFGAGTDYALLLISRYRDELRVHEDRYAAMRRAVERTTEAVLASATTVVLALLTLVLSAFPTTRGLGVACAVGIVVAAFAVMVVLPAALVLFGRWVFWPKAPKVGQPVLADAGSGWRRIGDTVARRPGTFVAVTVALLAGMATGLTQIDSGLGQADQFLEKPEAIATAERVAEAFPSGLVDPVVVVTAAPAGEVTATLEEVPGVVSVRPSGGDADLSRLDVVADAPAGSDASRELVESMRTALDGYDETYVGGTAAISVDEETAAAGDRIVILPLILGVVLLALVVLLRSVVAPLILVATVVATYLAALGLSWWLFELLGFERLDVGVPLIAFLFLVALGVDYNIFLVTRAAEESHLHGPREGMLRALTATGGVITGAGILLAAVFAVLGVLPLVVLAQLGVVIGIGVLLDTLIVRTLLVPAIALRLGPAFWWPSWR